MAKDLTTSAIDRQNILNNTVALPRIQDELGVEFLNFQGRYVITKQMVADFYGIDDSTIKRYLSQYDEELKHNGYVLCKGNDLKQFKLQFARVINEPTKTTVLGLFDFRSFINLGMLLVESEKAKMVRSRILDIVILTLNEKTGGNTRYINRRDINYLPSAVNEENYHKNLTDAINKYVDGHKTYKYSQIMDYIYKAVFCEKAKDYKKLLELSEKDNLRRTLYAEVLTAVSAFENGTADAIVRKAKEMGILTVEEVKEIIDEFASMPFGKPIVEDARTKMASRDNALRNVYHENLAAYLRAISPEEYDKFIGNLSVDFDHILEDNKDVLDRLSQ